MYRAGQGALDLQIAQTVAAIGAGEHWAMIDTHLRLELARIQNRISLLSVQGYDKKRMPLARLWSLLRGNESTEIELAIHQADQIILKVALQAELEFIESQQVEVAEERNAVAGADKHLSELLAKKEAWLVDTDAPGKATILEIARVRGNWQAFEDCLASALAVANAAQSQLLKATAYFEDAHNSSSRKRPGGFDSGSKEGQLQQASVHAAMADWHMLTLDIELAAIQVSSKKLSLKLSSMLTPLPTDLIGNPVVSHDKLQREATRISDVISELLTLQRRSRQELDALESKRRLALGDRR